MNRLDVERSALVGTDHFYYKAATIYDKSRTMHVQTITSANTESTGICQHFNALNNEAAHPACLKRLLLETVRDNLHCWWRGYQSAVSFMVGLKWTGPDSYPTFN